MSEKPDALIVMRLIDMHKVHPQQDSTHVCRTCGAPVGVYPTGQAALKRFPTMTILCSVCAEQMVDVKRDTGRPAGSAAEILEEARQSVPVKRA
jgi:hypothetical protein